MCSKIALTIQDRRTFQYSMNLPAEGLVEGMTSIVFLSYVSHIVSVSYLVTYGLRKYG